MARAAPIVEQKAAGGFATDEQQRSGEVACQTAVDSGEILPENEKVGGEIGKTLAALAALAALAFLIRFECRAGDHRAGAIPPGHLHVRK